MAEKVVCRHGPRGAMHVATLSHFDAADPPGVLVYNPSKLMACANGWNTTFLFVVQYPVRLCNVYCFLMIFICVYVRVVTVAVEVRGP